MIRLPVRLGFRSAQLVTRAVVGATGRAVSLAGHVIHTVAPGGADDPTSYTQAPAEEERPHVREQWPPAQPSRPPSDPRRELVENRAPAPEPGLEGRPTPPEDSAPQVQASPAGATTSIHTPGAGEHEYVSEEPELVREEAECGAEDGAGAGVTVVEPWEGYEQMSATEVTARVESANAAELAAVRLYESHHRRRQTVLAAVDSQLKTVNQRSRPV